MFSTTVGVQLCMCKQWIAWISPNKLPGMLNSVGIGIVGVAEPGRAIIVGVRGSRDGGAVGIGSVVVAGGRLDNIMGMEGSMDDGAVGIGSVVIVGAWLDITVGVSGSSDGCGVGAAGMAPSMS